MVEERLTKDVSSVSVGTFCKVFSPLQWREKFSGVVERRLKVSRGGRVSKGTTSGVSPFDRKGPGVWMVLWSW